MLIGLDPTVIDQKCAELFTLQRLVLIRIGLRGRCGLAAGSGRPSRNPDEVRALSRVAVAPSGV
jgi:hypothetical protein